MGKAAKEVDNKRKIWIFAAVIVSVTLLLGIVNRQQIYDQMYEWKLVPHPERLTELFFEDHQNLPTTYLPGQQQEVKFVIHNLEYRDTNYLYRINQIGDNEVKETLLTAEVTLVHDQTVSITQTVTLLDSGQRAKIEVELIFEGIELGDLKPSPQSQSIHYWLTREGI